MGAILAALCGALFACSGVFAQDRAFIRVPKPAASDGAAQPRVTAPSVAPATPRPKVDPGDVLRTGYRRFAAATEQQCQVACNGESSCKAWTWARPEAPGLGTCWLKSAEAPPRADPCCISGVKSNVASVAVPAIPVLKAPATRASPRSGQEMRRQEATTPSLNAAAPPRERVLATPGISPQALDFGRIWGGDVHQRAVTVEPPASALDGRVKIELQPSKLFSIAEIRVLASLAEGTPVQTANDRVKADGQARLGVDRTRMVVVGGTSPLDVAMRRGDSLVITIRSAPIMDQLASGPFDGSGPYHSSLKVQGVGWQATIPVSAGVEGQRLGVVASLESPRQPICRPESYDPRAGEPHPVEWTLSNRQGSGVEGRIELAELPPGFQIDPSAPFRAFKLAAGASTRLNLPAILTWGGVSLPRTGPGGDSGAGTYTGSLRVRYAGADTRVPFEITLLPSSRTWELKGEDGLRWRVDFRLYCRGRWNATWSVYNPNVAVQRDYMIDISWNGKRLARLSGRAGRLQYDNRTYSPESLFHPVIRDEYVRMLLEPPTARLVYTNVP